jgi:alpha-tubulin suppressor-like RCC1 family protein
VHTAVVTADRTLWAWGWNLYGQLGDGTSGRPDGRVRPGPVLRSDGTPLANVTAVAAGGQHTVAVVSDQSSVNPKGGRPPWPPAKP